MVSTSVSGGATCVTLAASGFEESSVRPANSMWTRPIGDAGTGASGMDADSCAITKGAYAARNRIAVKARIVVSTSLCSFRLSQPDNLVFQRVKDRGEFPAWVNRGTVTVKSPSGT